MADETTTGMRESRKKWNIGNIPPKGHDFVGKFFNRLWEAARREKINKLGLHKRFNDLHSQYRGKRDKRKYPNAGINPVFKTIQGVAAALTQKTPIAEIRNDDNPEDIRSKALDHEIKQWWKDVKAQFSFYVSCSGMGIYGTTIEKGVWDVEKDTADIIVRDQYGFFPAPGHKLCDIEGLPYCCDAFLMPIWEVRKKFKVPEEVNIPSAKADVILGLAREKVRGGIDQKATDNSNYASNYAVLGEDESPESEAEDPKALIIEVWIKDNSIIETPVYERQPVVDPNTGNPMTDDFGRPIETNQQVGIKRKSVYADGVRKVTICPGMVDANRHGVLDDRPNPSINWNMVSQDIARLVNSGIQAPTGQVDQATGQPIMKTVPVPEDKAMEIVYGYMKSCYLWGRFPFSAVPSLIDASQWWGFSIIEQIEELSHRAVGLLKRYLAAIDRANFPILVNPKNSGFANSQIVNQPGVIIRPTAAVANLIRFVNSLPPHRSTLEFIEFLLMQVDITSMRPEVTEGRRPKGISAAAAVIALQEQAASLFQPQVRNADIIIENRGMMFISLYKNFSTAKKTIYIDGDPITFAGVDLKGKYRYTVESGSSAPITKIGRRQQYVELFKLGAMDLESLLEGLEIPNASKIVERLVEQKGLAKAIDVLVQAGLPEDAAFELYQYLMKDQGGTGRNPEQNTIEGGKSGAAPHSGASEGMQSAYKEMIIPGKNL